MDGRVARRERNRQAVIDAALQLTADNGTFPSAESIAERAGVAARSVFHHFPDLAALFAAAAQTQGERYWSLLQPPSAGANLDDRLAAAVAQRAELFEGISAVRRVAARHEHEWPVLAARMRDSRAMLRRHLRRALTPEIIHLDRVGTAAVEAAGSWEFWEVLRRQHGLTVALSAAAVTSLIASTLDRALAGQAR